jgi:hypothetical protein
MITHIYPANQTPNKAVIKKTAASGGFDLAGINDGEMALATIKMKKV